MKIKKILIILLVPVLLATVGFGCKRSCAPGQPGGTAKKQPVELTFWGIFTESSQIEPLIRAFEAQNPNIKINYKNFGNDYPNYRTEIFNALAQGKGPDIWMVHHTWIKRDKDFLTPCPPELCNVQNFEETMVKAVVDDSIVDGSIYAMPWSLDTLALFYNKDLFNQAHILNPPRTWEEFTEDVKKLTKQNEKGQIIQAGAALGTGQNINRAPDILALLMMQNGAQMTDANRGTVTFNTSGAPNTPSPNGSQQQEALPGEEAFQFYTDFASPKKETYTWNSLQHYSIDAFVEGTLAMMFSYSYHAPTIQLKAPNLDFGVTLLPQVSGGREVNFANYWTNVVATRTPYKKEAWSFLVFAAQKEMMQKFCEDSRRPPSRRDLYQMFDNDPELQPFTNQILTAESWYRSDNDKTDAIFEEMIEDVVLGKKNIPEAMTEAAAEMQTMMK
ncbi:MAG: extracellular solute-binding protein [Candidatus Doudnabacteria bacterium]